jgi:hypothetical protein
MTAHALDTTACHESAHLHVQGQAAYVDDLPLTEGTLHAAPMLSNVALGRNVFGSLNSVGYENVGIGIAALQDNTTGSANTAINADALTNNETGMRNIAIGPAAKFDNVSGDDNIAMGIYSQYRNQSGSDNVSIGTDSYRQDQNGSNNVAIGTQAMYSVEDALKNVAVGWYALRGGTASLPTGITNKFCTAVGAGSQYITANAVYNASLGYYALYQSQGSRNVGVGANAGYQNYAGEDNIFIGYNAGENVAQKADGTNQIVIGKEAYTTGNNCVAIGYQVTAAASQVVLGAANMNTVRTSSDNTASSGAAAYRWSVVYAATGTINTSDSRDKQQVRELSAVEKAVAVKCKGLLRAFKFNDAVEAKSDQARIHFGVVAQDVENAFASEGLDAANYGLFCHDEWEGGDRYGIRYEELLAFIIGAL